MYTDVLGKYTGDKFGRLINDDGLSANLFHNGCHAFKVFNLGYGKSEVYAEAYAMSCVEQQGLPAAKVYQVLYEDGHWVIEMEYLRGPAMMDRVIAAAEAGDTAALDTEMNMLARLQHMVHSTGGGRLPSVKNALCDILRQKEALTEDQRKNVLDRLDALPDGDRVVHGDFQPFNILYDGGRPVIIDWATAGAGVPACDVARTWLNFSLPPVPALQRLEMNNRYFRAYQRESGMSFAEIQPWFPVMAGLSVGRDPVFTAHMQQYLL